MLGTSIAHYEILEKLGEGGMGVVWKARDTHLDRFVAIKVLASRKIDPAHIPRLVQEAKAASALNHPGIIHIYDVAQSDGLHYIAMEYVAGKTLEELIGSRGLRLSEALKFGTQIADAMAAAHAAGLVHRDLKPANIMVTQGGSIKLLDFGLAKLIELPTSDSDAAQALTTPRQLLSEQGAIIGTIPYMSPEQAEGVPLDSRSDIFSFGIILYEMISGVNPFRRELITATLSAIVSDEPKPLRELVPSLPAEAERTITRCLRKNPEQRLRSMADLSITLRELKEESDSGRLPVDAAPRALRRQKVPLLWLSFGLVVAALLVVGLPWWLHSRRLPSTTFGFVPVTTYPGLQKDPSLSPDGTQLAFSWDGTDEQKFHIYIKTIGPGPPLQLTRESTDDTAPAWSPDGGSIAFLRSTGSGHYNIIVIPALGGPEQKLIEINISDIRWMAGPYLSWTADSNSLVFPDRSSVDKPSALFLLPVQTGEKRQITFPPAGIVGDACGSISPDGQTLAFCRCARFGDWFMDLYTVTLTADLQPQNEAKQVTSDQFRLTGLAWTSPGTAIVYGAITEHGTQTLWRLPISKTSTVAATELPINNALSPTTSRRSPRLVFSRHAGGGTGIARLPIPEERKAAEPVVPFLVSIREEFAPRYSPDGKRIAFESSRGGSLQIWTCSSTGEECIQLTSMNSEFTGLPTWSPDGGQIAFYSRAQNKSQIFVIGANGTGLSQITSGDSNNFFPGWSRDGRWIYFSSSRSGTTQLWKVLKEGGTPIQVTHNGGFASRESSDGQSVYFVKTEAPDSPLWKLSLSSGEETQVLPSVHLYNFDPFDNGLYFIDSTSTLKLLNTAGQVTLVTQLPPSGYVGLSISPDRKSILLTRHKPMTSELIMVENFH